MYSFASITYAASLSILTSTFVGDSQL